MRMIRIVIIKNIRIKVLSACSNKVSVKKLTLRGTIETHEGANSCKLGMKIKQKSNDDRKRKKLEKKKREKREKREKERIKEKKKRNAKAIPLLPHLPTGFKTHVSFFHFIL